MQNFIISWSCVTELKSIENWAFRGPSLVLQVLKTFLFYLKSIWFTQMLTFVSTENAGEEKKDPTAEKAK